MTEAILLVACVLLAGAVVALAVALRRQREDTAQAVALLHAGHADVERRLAALEAPPEPKSVADSERSRHGLAGARPVVPEEPRDEVSRRARPTSIEGDDQYVITRLGSQDAEVASLEPPDARLFADLVLRESVVKAASFAHGVRRGFSPENRNRIWFEMRRELKRARKQRRAEEREAVREWRARQRAAVRDQSRDGAREDDAA